MRHTVKGTKDINLLGGLTDPPAIPNNTQSFTVGVHSVSIIISRLLFVYVNVGKTVK